MRDIFCQLLPNILTLISLFHWVLAIVRWVLRYHSSARERMIGWYHTGPKLRASDQEINEVFKRFIPRPVMVIVNVSEDHVGIPTSAYFAVEEIKDVSFRSIVYVYNVP